MQQNRNIMSTVVFPPSEGFFNEPLFCNVAAHILQVSCGDEDRKYFLEKKYPKICQVLIDFETYFGNETDCKNWPTNYFADYEQINETLTTEIFNYGRDNLALVSIFFQSPYITKLKKDVEMTFMSVVANTGTTLLTFEL